MTMTGDGRAKQNAEFGRLLSGAINSIATYEGKTAPIVEQDLGQQIGLTVASIQRYKSGKLPPEPRTIRIFAEAAIKRGYLNRNWLTRFLHAAAYPNPNDLIRELVPATQSESASARVLHNLPAPTYSHFVMREQPLRELMEALQQRAAVVVLSSFGGMGKTSLAREIAARCLAGNQDLPAFDGAVWVSDAERPGYTTLNAVLDEIAYTLGYAGYASYPQEEKRREVEQLLRRQRVLVVIDNFETVTDTTLLKWLIKLPEPSKALITTREYRREYRQGTWTIELRGMSESECAEFIRHRAQVLRLDRLMTGHDDFAPLLEVTGGNPKAIDMALGCLKYERRTLTEVVDDLYSARGDLFNDLFQRSWALLDEAARRVLLAATFFAASVNADALSVTADVRGLTFARALERLGDLAFLEVLQTDLSHDPTYSLHPLVRAFAASELSRDSAFEASARERWAHWYVDLASQVGYCRNDLARLELLDPERIMLHTVADWMIQHQRNAELIQFANGIAFYCYVRGLQNQDPPINLAAARAAQALNRSADEVRWLAHHIQRLARAGDLTNAQSHLARIQTLAAQHAHSGEPAEYYHHSLATYYLAQDDADKAEREWRTLLADPAINRSTRLITIKWIATCMRQKRQLSGAQELLEHALQGITADDNQRALISLQLELTRVYLEADHMDDAAAMLASASARVESGTVERHQPDVHLLQGYLLTRSGKPNEARHAFSLAADGFLRLGYRREADEARMALSALV